MTKQTGQWNLGQLIDALARREQDQQVRFDFCDCFPKGLASYRGYYEDLSLGWTHFGEETHEPPTVAVVSQWLKDAVGKVFTGYKGGDYRMGRETSMWVANYSQVSGTYVTGVAADYTTIITTAWEAA